MVAPVTKSDARDAKKTAVPAHSSGLPKRPAGVRVMISWYRGDVFTGRHVGFNPPRCLQRERQFWLLAMLALPPRKTLHWQTQELESPLLKKQPQPVCPEKSSRRWTVCQILVERLKNLGVCASRASVTTALAELGLELELSGWAPWRLLERGTGWILELKSVASR